MVRALATYGKDDTVHLRILDNYQIYLLTEYDEDEVALVIDGLSLDNDYNDLPVVIESILRKTNENYEVTYAFARPKEYYDFNNDLENFVPSIHNSRQTYGGED